MMETAGQRANRAQLEASDPGVSAFVAASAGSGKTKLLIDRLLRLMLSGAEPSRIQCLTFTKAGAAEMAVRLQRRLGEWVTYSDQQLDAELARLNVPAAAASREQARALFARVLDLPGGMRIGTIHAFCQSLLRRFPLEAELSPHFRLVEDQDAAEALREARERMLAAAETCQMQAALTVMAGLTSLDSFGKLVAELGKDEERLRHALELGRDLLPALRRAMGVDAATQEEIIASAVRWDDAALRGAAKIVAREGAAKVQVRSEKILEWLNLPAADRAGHWDAWREEFLTSGKARGNGAFVSPKLAGQRPDLLQVFLDEASRILDVEDRRRAWRVAEISAALLMLAKPVLKAYRAEKEESGLVDYDDLIDRTSRLLIDPGAAWVLYKLDGGLDHLLLDEVQDTAPEQWEIAAGLTAEFFAGLGARDAPRTLFAVGDRKQSIFSFQGADPDAFDLWRGKLRGRVEHAGQGWRDTRLDVSFRSTPPVLALVDRVFANPAAALGVVAEGETLTHHADRAGHAGSVELWPLTPRPESDPPAGWEPADRNHGQQSAPQHLADTLSDWIARQLSDGFRLHSRDRALLPGDIMILLRRRNDFARALVRALKARGVPVAGLDRLVLTEQPAVQDLLALCDTLLLPQDDLSLACVLTSPLGFLTDDSLTDLAAARPEPRLWDTLRRRHAERDDWDHAWRFLSALLPRVDYATPYSLLSEALGPLGARARLFARLGREAAEPVDELLGAALRHAENHPPSLQGFVHAVRQSGSEIKREPEGAGGLVRVMTVHGAKGLQAPLVILPDTTALPPDDGPLAWAPDPYTQRDVPLWSPRADVRCQAVERLREHTKARRVAEHNRLLYVALTRAEDRLVVCGWQPHRDPPAGCWYDLVARGFAALDAERLPFDPWHGELLHHAAPQTVPPRREKASDDGPPEKLPGWAGSAPGWRPAPPPPEPARPFPLAPSRPEGAQLGPVPHAASPLADRDGGKRFLRGQLVHALLQHLPALPSDQREEAARAWVTRPAHGLAPRAAATLVREVMAILDHPHLADVFGPAGRAEVPLTGMAGDSVVGGLVDRLAVLPDRVIVVDFKTSRDPPATPQATPVLYLRQMAAYRGVLRDIFPDRPVQCALVWTQAARVDMLPDALLA